MSVAAAESYTVVSDGSLSFPASSVAVASIISPVNGLGLGVPHVQLPAVSATTGLGLHTIGVPRVGLSVVRVIEAHGSLVPVIDVAHVSTGFIVGALGLVTSIVTGPSSVVVVGPFPLPS